MTFLICAGALAPKLRAQSAPPPTITAISPNNGPTNGGTVVIISGTGFQTGATVNFGPLPALSVNVNSSNTITAVTPPAFFGPADVSVMNADSQSVTLAGGFTYFIQPIYNWTTIVGTAAAGSVNGTNNGARFIFPQGMATDSAGNIYIANNGDNTIRKLTPTGTNWVSSTIAGTPGIAGSTDGVNSAALFNQPDNVAIDSSGNVYVTDTRNQTIRELTPVGADWVSSTIAGSPGLTGTANGTNNTIRFSNPTGIAADASGNLYVSDRNDAIRKLTPVGPNWVSSTITGGFGSTDGTNVTIKFSSPDGLAFDTSGNLYVADTGNRTIRRLTPMGTNWVSSTIAGTPGMAAGTNDGVNNSVQFSQPSVLVVDANTNIYITDSTAFTIRLLTPVGTNWVSSTIAGTPRTRGSADGTSNASMFSTPEGITLDGQGDVIVADTFNFTIRELTPSGTNWVSETIAGELTFGNADGTNDLALFANPSGIAVDAFTNLYVGNTTSQTIRKITPVGSDWATVTIAGQAFTSGSANGTNTGTTFAVPFGVAVDTNGNIYVADEDNNVIRKLTLMGTNYVASTFAGHVGLGGFPPNSFELPNGVAVDAAGNVYVADTDNSAITKLTSAGGVSGIAIAGSTSGQTGSTDSTGNNIRFLDPQGITVDAHTNLYITDTGNDTIRKLALSNGTWVSSTIAGAVGVPGSADGVNNASRFLHPVGIAVDRKTNLYVADTGNFTIRKLTPSGSNWISTTIGGSPGIYGSADGTNNNARFASATALAVDTNGNLYVADSANNTIRMGALTAVTLALPPLTANLVAGGGLKLQLTGASGQNYILQAATNLTPPVQWKPIDTNAADVNGNWSFTDTKTSANPARYYRVTTP